jgi:hypothetical protein
MGTDQYCGRREEQTNYKRRSSEHFTRKYFRASSKVGTTRFELATPCTPCKCATGLRYVPKPVTTIFWMVGCKSTYFIELAKFF